MRNQQDLADRWVIGWMFIGFGGAAFLVGLAVTGTWAWLVLATTMTFGAAQLGLAWRRGNPPWQRPVVER